MIDKQAILNRALELKNEGNSLFKVHDQGSIREAIAKYTEALSQLEIVESQQSEAEGQNKSQTSSESDGRTSPSVTSAEDDLLSQAHQQKAVLFSNRSAAYLKLGDTENALSDAKNCVRVNPAWAKAHSRKGAALKAKNLFSQAAQSFRTASDLDTAENVGKGEEYQKLAEECEQEDRYVRGIDQRPSSAAAASSPSPSPSASASASATSSRSSSPGTSDNLKDFLLGSSTRRYLAVCFVLRVTMLVSAITSILAPAVPALQVTSSVFMLCTAVLNAMTLIWDHKSTFMASQGQPMMHRAAPMVMDVRSFRLLSAFVFSASDGGIFPNALLLHPELGHIAEYGNQLGELLNPALTARARDAILNSSLLTTFVREDPARWATMDARTRWSKYNERMLAFGGDMELYTGIALLVGVLTGTQRLLTVLIYLQSLTMRYRLSVHTQRSFAGLNAQLEPIFNRFGLGSVYTFIKTQLSRLVAN